MKEYKIMIGTNMQNNEYLNQIAKALKNTEDESMRVVGRGGITRDIKGIRKSDSFKAVFKYQTDRSSKKKAS